MSAAGDQSRQQELGSNRAEDQRIGPAVKDS